MAIPNSAIEVDDEDVAGKGMIHDRFMEADEVNSILAGIVEKANDEIAKECDLERLTTILNVYQEQPNLLDPSLERLLSTCLSIVRKHKDNWNVLHQTFKYVYTISKVRGYQVIHRCMPHETSDLQPVLAMLECQSPTDSTTWQTRYVLLLWLSTLCLIPFDLSRFDSNVKANSASNSSTLSGSGGNESGVAPRTMMERLIAIGKRYVVETDVHRIAGFALSTLLSRPDARHTQLGNVLDWQLAALADCQTSQLGDATRACCLLRAVATLFKRARRAEILPHTERVLHAVARRDELESTDNILLRKYRVKVLQRCGLTFLPNRVAKWRYQRGCRSLLMNLAAADVPMSTGIDTTDKHDSGETDDSQKEAEDDEDFDVPSEVEEIIGLLLNSLKDRDTIVRWSSAKGIGRITNRLPKTLAMDIVSALLNSCSPLDTDAAWHGACLALAELARRGLLLPSSLGDVVRTALSALRFDEKRGAHSVGAHVRDAACYVCWSLARAFDATLMREYVAAMAQGLVHAFLFDREVSVRRAASAAFQENVGRQGYFPHGIDILTTCDYFAVGNLQNAYLELSVYVASFEEYAKSLVDHLVSSKIGHWDVHIRELSAKALHRLTPIALQHTVQKLPALLDACLSCELYLKHGALLAIAEIVHALYLESSRRKEPLVSLIQTQLNSSFDALDACRRLPAALANAGAFTQFGSEHLRRAICAFIERFSLSEIPLSDDHTRCWLELLDDCVRNNDVSTQRSAVTALRPFLALHFSAAAAHSTIDTDLVGRYRRELREASVEYVRVGLCAALGCVPADLLLARSLEQPDEANLRLAMQTLIEASRPPPESRSANVRPDRYWTNARSEAVKALISVVETCSVERALVVEPRLVEATLTSLLDGIGDYTIDPIKGDQGRKVREACIVALQTFATLVVRHQSQLLSESMCEQILAAVAQQAMEKIIQTRALACRTFVELLHAQPPLPHVPCADALLDILPSSLRDEDWSNGEFAFPRFVRLLLLPPFSYRVMLGLVVSVGDLAEFRKASSNALVDLLNNSSLLETTDCLRTLGNVFEKWTKNERVSVPLLKTLEQLLSSGCLLRAELTSEPDSPATAAFFEQLLRLVVLTRNEINRSLSTNRILAAVDVFCGLLQFEKLNDQLYKKCLSQVLILMAHSDIPRVRRSTATRLYEALLLYGDALNERCSEAEIEELNTLLNDTNWEVEAVEHCRMIRNRICDIVGLPHPIMQQRPTA